MHGLRGLWLWAAEIAVIAALMQWCLAGDAAGKGDPQETVGGAADGDPHAGRDAAADAVWVPSQGERAAVPVQVTCMTLAEQHP